MRHLKILFALLGALTLLCGCATPPGFMADRGRDAADIFTFSTGLGGGAKARVGPLQCGLLYDSTLLGLRGGEWMTASNFTNDYSAPVLHFLNIQQKEPDILDTQMILIGSESFYHFPRAAQRGKTYSADTTLLITTASPKSGRGKDGPEGGKYPASYYTQIEAVLSCGAGFRFGFNPGEFLDFLLGWWSMDIYGDDLNAPPTAHQTAP